MWAIQQAGFRSMVVRQAKPAAQRFKHTLPPTTTVILWSRWTETNLILWSRALQGLLTMSLLLLINHPLKFLGLESMTGFLRMIFMSKTNLFIIFLTLMPA